SIPLLTEEGWLRHKQKAGEAHLSAADGVVAHKIMFQNAFRNLSCERPPLLREEGNTPNPNSYQFIHTFIDLRYKCWPTSLKMPATAAAGLLLRTLRPARCDVWRHDR